MRLEQGVFQREHLDPGRMPGEVRGVGWAPGEGRPAGNVEGDWCTVV